MRAGARLYAGRRPSPRRGPRPRLVVSAGGRRPRWVGLVWLAAALAGLVLLLHSPLFLVSELRVRGLQTLTAAEVQRQAGLTSRFYLWQLRPRRVEERLRRHPRVAGAVVTVRWPRDVVVTVAERRPAAYVKGTGPTWLEVDASGHVLALAGTRVPLDTPLVTLEREIRASPGIQIRSPGLAAALTAVSLLRSRWRDTASELHVRQDGQLVLYLLDGIPVYLGWGEDVGQRLRVALAMVGAVGRREAVSYVDVRSLRRPVVGLRQGFSPPAPPPEVPPHQALP